MTAQSTNMTFMDDGVPVADVALPPPAVKKSRRYRCADGSAAYVDFFADRWSASLRTLRDAQPIQLKARGEDGPFVSEGYSVSANAAEAYITLPGKERLLCKS